MNGQRSINKIKEEAKFVGKEKEPRAPNHKEASKVGCLLTGAQPRRGAASIPGPARHPSPLGSNQTPDCLLPFVFSFFFKAGDELKSMSPWEKEAARQLWRRRFGVPSEAQLNEEPLSENHCF